MDNFTSKLSGWRSNQYRRLIRPQQDPLIFSNWSTPSVPHSGWASRDFLLGAGLVVIQPSTNRILLIFDKSGRGWMLPRGRKDLGESLEDTAFREGYEESGYHAERFPLYMPTNAPAPPHDREAYYRPSAEPIYVTVEFWRPRVNRQGKIYDTGGEYIVHWYIGQIPHDAIYERGTGMPDEQGYTSHLLSWNEALAKLQGSSEEKVVIYAWAVFQRHVEIVEQRREEVERSNAKEEGSSGQGVGEPSNELLTNLAIED